LPARSQSSNRATNHATPGDGEGLAHRSELLLRIRGWRAGWWAAVGSVLARQGVLHGFAHRFVRRLEALLVGVDGLGERGPVDLPGALRGHRMEWRARG